MFRGAYVSGKQPFMPLFFGDFLASTAEWSGEERALYLLLLSYQWSMGSLPTDSKRLAKLVDYERRVFDEHWPMVSKKFVERDDRLFNLRLEQHRLKTQELSAKNSAAGKKGAESKWRKDGERHVSANGEPIANAMQAPLAERHRKIDGVTHSNPSHPILKSKNSPENSPQDTCVTSRPDAHAGHTHAREGAEPETAPAQPTLARAHVFGDDAELMDAFAVVRSTYPKFTGRQDWPNAEHHWRMRIEQGAGIAELQAGVDRYAAYVAAGGVSSSAFVMTPGKFFGAADRPWSQPWDVPASTKPAPRIRTATDIAEEYEARAAAAGAAT
jgi:uncharacterized protein YdaU (DUF1376 family)